MFEGLEGILFATVRSGTPLLLLTLGILVNERAGVLNLGQEGMLATGAAAAFVTTALTHDPWLGVLAGVGAGILCSVLFAGLALGLRTNQIATGLALAIFGTGLASFMGSGYAGTSIDGLEPLPIPLLHALPVLGPALFAQDMLVYLGFGLCGALWWFFRSRHGLVLSAVGHNPVAAHQLGYPVLRLRTLAVLFGGGCAGLAGAYLSLAYTPLWSEGMAAGRGWICLALVVFASWRVLRVLGGAYLFGLAGILHLALQNTGWSLPPQLLAALPYLLTLVVLVLISARTATPFLSPPEALGRPFPPED